MSDRPSFLGLDQDVIDRALQHIAESLNQGEAEFLFGAGMSIDSGIPAGRQLSLDQLNHFFPSS
jgi:hypothetical protein